MPLVSPTMTDLVQQNENIGLSLAEIKQSGIYYLLPALFTVIVGND